MTLEDLTVYDAVEYVGLTPEGFASVRSSSDWRIGQIWYNNLTKADRDRLNGTLRDPFYFDDWSKVLEALAYLLETK